MYTLDPQKVPQPDETLDSYIRRLRKDAQISQQHLATMAGIHLQSVGKLERGKTTRLNQKTKTGLARALSIPTEYLEAICSGEPIAEIENYKFCPQCWTPGTEPDSAWTLYRAKYCLLCGSKLRNHCTSCGEILTSFKHKFCPHCGTSYQEKPKKRK
ncbi:MAG: zinc ribbon domain-containing protein [Trichodesmium sp. MO_231.B1]|nr:zinc ribbon domain-containing protein [Trichodesmium sp. MO_231.B1]